MHIRSPLAALYDTSPTALAGRLLDEIARGMVPVWPTTERFADRLAEGLETLKDERGIEVHRAIAMAPQDTPLDWRRRLMPIIS